MVINIGRGFGLMNEVPHKELTTLEGAHAGSLAGWGRGRVNGGVAHGIGFDVEWLICPQY